LKKTNHILNIIKLLLIGKKICIKEYAKNYELHIRTLQRYFSDIIELFEDNIVKIDNCYKLLKLDDILAFDKKEIEILADLAIIADLNIEKKLFSKIYTKYADIYSIKTNPFEVLKVNFFHDLKEVIKYRQYIDIEYFSDKRYFFDRVKPLKIVFAENNWYLAIMSNDELNRGFKFLRINFIKDINIYQDTFKRDKEALNFIQTFNSVFQEYKAKSFEVKVKVNKEVERFFDKKHHLTQQNYKKDELILIFNITNKMEILPLIKKWLPHLKIISPLWLKKEFEEELKKYLTLL